MTRASSIFMSGVPELLILQLLSRQEMYGYQLVKEIRLVSNEAFNLAEGVVYPLLHSLEKKGALNAKEKTVNGRSRVYYRVTAKGKRRLDSLHQQWQRVSSGINSALGENYV